MRVLPLVSLCAMAACSSSTAPFGPSSERGASDGQAAGDWRSRDGEPRDGNAASEAGSGGDGQSKPHDGSIDGLFGHEDANGAREDGTVGHTDGSGLPRDAGAIQRDGSQSQADRLRLPDAITALDGWNPTNQPACNGTVWACSDGIDNDGDGLIDSQDPECTGPCDNDEGSFATGIPGDNQDACKQDCFFDGNSGSGDDGCEWDLRCDPKDPGSSTAKKCPYRADFKNCPSTQSALCIKSCLDLTPNGCDCFGCCTIFTKQGAMTVLLGSGPECSTTSPDKCAPCTQNQGCFNDCGRCELCLGKTLADIPADCYYQPRPDAGVPASDSSQPNTDGGSTTPKDGGGTTPKDSGGTTPKDGGSTTPKDSGGTTPKDGGGTTSKDSAAPAPDRSVTPDQGNPLPFVCPAGVSACLDNSWCKVGYYCLTGCCKLGIL